MPIAITECSRNPERVHHDCDILPIIEGCVMAVFEVPREGLRISSRGKADVAFARQVAMYLAHVVAGLTLTDVGKRFGRDRTTAAYACRLIEDRRDDPAFDRRLSALEAAIQSGFSRLSVAGRAGRQANG
ncbi:helix-turn-helix domain-containing protein [Stappia sediminis]|nr:helix-turn-helix domain-containing protein [Stappia sediminis]